MRTIGNNMIARFLSIRILAAVSLFALLNACSALLLSENPSAGVAGHNNSRSPAQISADNETSVALHNAFRSDLLLRSEQLTVSVSDGIVTLGGVVGSFEARDHAVQVAEDMVGRKRLKNQLQVNTRR